MSQIKTKVQWGSATFTLMGFNWWPWDQQKHSSKQFTPKTALERSHLMVDLNGSSPWVCSSPAHTNFTEETQFHHNWIINPDFTSLQLCHFWQCIRISQVLFSLLNPVVSSPQLFLCKTLYFLKNAFHIYLMALSFHTCLMAKWNKW